MAGSLKAGAWSSAEDEVLIGLMQERTPKWGIVAKAVNQAVHGGLAIRTGKKCKERWINHLNPAINRGPWTPQEDLAILLGHEKHKNRWSLISKEVGNRTEGAIKNRVKSLLMPSPPARGRAPAELRAFRRRVSLPRASRPAVKR